MKTEVKKLDGTKREISVEVSGDLVKNKFEDVFKRVTQEARVPGFRPGHAPREIIEKNFSGQIHEQVLKELVPDIYNQAIDQEKLDVVELPNIFDVKLDRSSLTFKVHVETSPEIALKDYKGIKVNYKKVSVSEDDIKRSLDSLKEAKKAGLFDDGLARSLGYPDLSELRNVVEKQLYLHKENQERMKVENGIIESLVKGLDFKLPKSLIDRQLQDMVRQAKVDLAMKGVPRDKIEQEEANFLKELKPEAENQVRIYLVLAEIAKKENITIDDSMPRKVMEFLLKEADWKIEA